MPRRLVDSSSTRHLRESIDPPLGPACEPASDQAAKRINNYQCKPSIVAKAGLSVREHQERTVVNFIELERLWGGAQAAKLPPIDQASCPFMPVLQGWEPSDYFLRTNGLPWLSNIGPGRGS
jgi:hypothetical protein